MKAEQFPELRYFLSCYFNQDWDLDAPSSEGIVQLFLTQEQPGVVERLCGELRELLAANLSEDQLARILSESYCFYLPSADGLSNSDWLAQIGATLSGASRSK